jgi:hypothetical protein
LQGPFAGEIGALLEIVRRRDYVGHVQRAIAHIDQTEQAWAFPLNVRQEYFSVYRKNAHQLGLLNPPLPSDIARFYTFCFSILEDCQTMSESGRQFSTVEESRRMLSELLALFESVNEIGTRIVSQIDKQGA